MKTISIKEAQKIAFDVMQQAEKRREEYFEKEVRVVVMEEDIEEELLRQCRQHVQFLCDDLFIHLRDGKVFNNAWVEAGEQVYAQWRGWL